MMNDKTREFIRCHADEDVRMLALRGTRDDGVDLMMVLQQIAGRQTARRKLPSWAAMEDIVYPPHLNMEQCSSELTARYKAAIAGQGRRMADLTGGFGVDFYFMAQGFQERCYVEQSAELCSMAESNMKALGLACMVSCADSVGYLRTMEKADLIYLDPARRNEHGGRTYGIEDCTPNVIELLPLLAEKADRVMLKLSPMLDWHQAVAMLQHPFAVQEVHIVSTANECKELLLVLGHEEKELRLVCVNDGQVFEVNQGSGSEMPQQQHLSFGLKEEHDLCCDTAPTAHMFLYEPNASIMKAGCFQAVARRFGVVPVAENSHLFLSHDEIVDFPGSKFQILAVSSVNKKEINQKLTKIQSPLKSANISVRNFPMTAEQLRKKLKLKDGGDTYIFATTLHDGSHKLLICRKFS